MDPPLAMQHDPRLTYQMENVQSTDKRPFEDDGFNHSEPGTKRQITDFSDGGYYNRDHATLNQAAESQNGNGDSRARHHINSRPLSRSAWEADPEVIDLLVDTVCKRSVRPAPDFPRFKSGNVYIELAGLHRKYSYQLHAAVLSRASLWFERTLRQSIEEFDERMAANISKCTGISARYELRSNLNTDIGVLARATLTKLNTPEVPKAAGTPQPQPKIVQVLKGNSENHPPSTPESIVSGASSCEAPFYSASSQTEITETAPIPKIEKDRMSSIIKKEEKDSGPSTGDEEIALYEVHEAYNNLFLMYYNKTPNIDTNNVEKALRQAEILIQIAALYGSIPIVRPYLSNCMLQYGRDLYKAILKDPPRWLQVSGYLESAPIFKEAVVHIVGSYPHWPWKTVQQEELPEEVHEIIQTKLDNLQTLKTNIDRTLFTSSIRICGQEIRLSENDMATFDTWFMVQLWRDWFCRSLVEAKAARDRGNGRCADGNMYRAMWKGGDAYLPIATVQTTLSAFRGDGFAIWNQRDVEEDLRIMKEFARKQVEPLCANNSMLVVEEEGIEYFTCTKVETDELPWLKQDDSD